jgi:hypothetical protein
VDDINLNYGWTSYLPDYAPKGIEHYLLAISLVSYHLWIIPFPVSVPPGFLSDTPHPVSCAICTSVWTTSISDEE